MRHQVHGKKLNRTSNHRKALFKNLVMSLFEHGAIETTEVKAKSIRGLVDTLIHRAQKGGVATSRVLASFFGTRDIVNKLMNEIAPAMKDRVSGFTRIVRIGNRIGDDATTVRMELVAKIEPKKEEVKEVAKKVEAVAEKALEKTAKEVKKTVSTAKKAVAKAAPKKK